MPAVIDCGTATIATHGKAHGIAKVEVGRMLESDEVMLTPKTTDAGNGPEGKGPLYCAFLMSKERGSFHCLVYDIQAGSFNVDVQVDWVVVRRG